VAQRHLLHFIHLFVVPLLEELVHGDGGLGRGGRVALVGGDDEHQHFVDTLDELHELIDLLGVVARVLEDLAFVEQLSECLEHLFHDLRLLGSLDLLLLEIQVLSLHLLSLVLEVFLLRVELLLRLLERGLVLLELLLLELDLLALHLDHLVQPLESFLLCLYPLVLLHEAPHHFLGIYIVHHLWLVNQRLH
jgi:hypothetical protein